MRGIKELPYELRCFIISLVLQSNLIPKLQQWKYVELDSSVFSVAFSPKGDTFLAGKGDKTGELWDWKTKTKLTTFQGHVGPICSVAFVPGGESVVIGSTDGTARLCSVTTGELIRTFEGCHSSSIRSIACSPDGKTVLTGSKDTTSSLWSLQTGKSIEVFKEHTGAIWSVAWKPDGEAFITGSDDQTARIWDLTTKKVILILVGDKSCVYSVAWSLNGKTVITGHFNGTVCLWDSVTGERLRVFSQPLRVFSETGFNNSLYQANPLDSVAFSPDGKFIIGGARNGCLFLWCFKTGNLVDGFGAHTSKVSIAVNVEEQTIMTGGLDRYVNLLYLSPALKRLTVEGKEAAFKEFIGWYCLLLKKSATL